MQTSGAVVQSHVLLLVLHNTTSFTNIALKKDDLCSGCNTSRMYKVYTWNKVRQNHAFILWHFVIFTHCFVLLLKQGGLFVLRNEGLIQSVQLKSGPILIWVIYLLRFTTCYITKLTCIYSKCWKWCQIISMHLFLVLTLTSAHYNSCPKVNLFHGIF
jgi:hypothetical protein